MAINESIWGTPETWVNSRNNSDLDDAEIKVGATGYSTFAEQYTAERIALNALDTSPCFWGISAASMWGNMYAAYAYAPDGLENPIEIGEKLVSEPHENGLPLMLIDSTMSSPLQYGLGYQKRYTPVESNIMTEQSPYTRDVVLNFNYQKIMCIPYMIVMDTSFNKVYTTFEAYFDNNSDYYRTTYPYICAITYTMCLGEAGERIGESSGIVPLIPYTFTGSNAQYETRYEFSANGFSALKTSYITNDSNAGVVLSCDNTGDEITVNYNTPNATVSTDDTGYRYRYCVNEPDRDEFYTVPLYVHDDSGLWEYIRSSSVWWDISCVIDIRNQDVDEVREYCLKQIAYLGFPFVIAYADRQKAIGTAGVYLPVFDENGVTTGDYVEGVDALELPNAEWSDGRSSGYDPNRPPTPESGDYGDLNNLGHNRYLGKSLNVYVMPAANYTHSFLPALNGLYQNKTPDDWTIDFQGENPSNYIVAAFNTFFAVPTQGISTNIMLGVVDTGISADVYDRGKPQSESFTFGTRHIDPLYYDFRDYAPYTNIELYLPLCGTIPLETAYVMNHDISITYWYDITTMSCTACVYRDNLLYKTLDGSLGVPAPLLATDMGNYQNQIKQLENAKTQNNMRIATSALSLTAGIAAAVASGGTAIVPEAMGIAGGLAGFSKSIETANEIEYKIDHSAPSISTTGASESQNNMCVGQLIPKLIIKRPVMLPNKNDTIYSKTVGNACCINNNVGENTGLIKCSNVDLSGVTATAAEISAIQNLLTSGVYV